MKRKYGRLTESEREEISRMLAQGISIRGIALGVRRHVSTISREVRKGSSNRYTYRAVRSQRRARRRAGGRRQGKRKLRLNTRLRHFVEKKLKQRWSPEQIAQALIREYPSEEAMRVSHETIYTYLYVLPRGELRQELLSCLRRKHRRRHRRRGPDHSETLRRIRNMISIEERPAEVADRTVPGHWEGDLLIGRNRQSALGTLVERTTRFLILVPLKNRKASEVRKAFAREMKKFPRHAKLSLTYDQGREMAEHTLFTKDTQIRVYFAHPASPWERGTNENTNGLIRQFFPKGTDFSKVLRREVKHVQDLMNGRPRKVLEWRTPYEAWQKDVALKV